VFFCGQYINMSAIARSQGISVGYVSQLLNGERDGNIRYYVKISSVLGITIDEMLAGIEERKQLRIEAAKLAMSSYSKRVAEEDQSGLPPLPSLRLPQDRRRKA